MLTSRVKESFERAQPSSIYFSSPAVARFLVKLANRESKFQAPQIVTPKKPFIQIQQRNVARSSTLEDEHKNETPAIRPQAAAAGRGCAPAARRRRRGLLARVLPLLWEMTDFCTGYFARKRGTVPAPSGFRKATKAKAPGTR